MLRDFQMKCMHLQAESAGVQNFFMISRVCTWCPPSSKIREREVKRERGRDKKREIKREIGRDKERER
jgi:hypothetical protein